MALEVKHEHYMQLNTLIFSLWMVLEVHIKSSYFTVPFTEGRAVWAAAAQAKWCSGRGCNRATQVYLMRTAGGKQMAPGVQNKALT